MGDENIRHRQVFFSFLFFIFIKIYIFFKDNQKKIFFILFYLNYMSGQRLWERRGRCGGFIWKTPPQTFRQRRRKKSSACTEMQVLQISSFYSCLLCFSFAILRHISLQLYTRHKDYLNSLVGQDFEMVRIILYFSLWCHCVKQNFTILFLSIISFSRLQGYFV